MIGLITMKGWICTGIAGILIIGIQLLIPDLVPDAINKILSDNTSTQFIGVSPVTKATLAIWNICGFALFIAGVFGTFISYRRSQSE